MPDDYNNNNDEISLEELITLLRRGFIWAVSLATIFAVLAIIFTTIRPTSYRASSKLLVTLPSAQINNYGDVGIVTANAIDPSAYVAAAKSLPILQDAIEKIAGRADDAEIQRQALNLRLRLKVDTIVERLSSIVTLNVTNENPKRAIAEVDSLTSSLVEWDKQRATRNISQIITALEEQIIGIDQQLAFIEQRYLTTANMTASSNEPLNNSTNNTNATDTANQDESLDNNDISDNTAANTIENLEVLSLQQQYQSLQELKTNRINELNYTRTLQSSAVGLLEVIEFADPSYEALGIHPFLAMIIGFILGGFLGYVAYFLRQALSKDIEDIEALSRATGLSILADFPHLEDNNQRLPQEQVRYLRTNVLLNTSTIEKKVILVTSAVASEGKSSVSASLAESFVRSGYKTLLVDADIRKPSLFKRYGVYDNNEAGLQEHLQQRGKLETVLHLQISHQQYLAFIPTMTASTIAPETLARAIKPCIRQWQDFYDVVVIDSAPLLAVADSLIIAPHSNITLFVTSMKDATTTNITTALQMLQRIGANIIGLAVTHNKKNQKSVHYGYDKQETPKSQQGDMHAPPL